MSDKDTRDTHEADAMRFMQLVGMFQLAAMQQMGKLPNPVTNEIDRDLVQARASIDILEMLKRRTEGNLDEHEAELLGKVLFELQMNYVDEVDRGSEAPEAEGEPEPGADDAPAGPDDSK